jgi:hypothetical protein
MVPALKIGHVRSKLSRTTIAVRIEAEFSTSSGNIDEVILRSDVTNMGDPVSEEWFSVRAHQPVSTVNFGKMDVRGIASDGILALRIGD